MYFPYLRGKQNELLAIRELSVHKVLNDAVCPIIEPVRANLSSGMPRLMDALEIPGIKPLIVLNPQVGDIREIGSRNPIVDFFESGNYAYEPTLLLESAESFKREVSRHQSLLTGPTSFSVVAPFGPGVETLQSAHRILASKSLSPSKLIVAAQSNARVSRAWRDGGLVTLVDPFKPEDRNADYVNDSSEEFSDEYFYYKGDGWNGVSDYQTIGARWTVGGFTPRVVAIHWTYEDLLAKRVMVGHFTSAEGDESQGDVASKFLVAASNLVGFLDKHEIPNTFGATQIRKHVKAGTFPGLGPVKKFSIENHIELIARISRS